MDPLVSLNEEISFQILTPKERIDHSLKIMEILCNNQIINESNKLKLTNEERSESKSLKMLKGKLHSKNCLNCKLGPFTIKCECGYKYCNKCLVTLFEKSVKCFGCRNEFSNRFIIQISKIPEFRKFELAAICKSCNKRKIEKYIPNSCNHLCITCIQKSFDIFEMICPICFTDLAKIDEYKRYKLLCEGCGQETLLIKGSLKALPCEDSLCINCIKNSINSRKCKHCSRKLNQIEILHLLSEISDFCTACNQNFFRNHIGKDPLLGIRCDTCSNTSLS